MLFESEKNLVKLIKLYQDDLEKASRKKQLLGQFKAIEGSYLSLCIEILEYESSLKSNEERFKFNQLMTPALDRLELFLSKQSSLLKERFGYESILIY